MRHSRGPNIEQQLKQSATLLQNLCAGQRSKVSFSRDPSLFWDVHTGQTHISGPLNQQRYKTLTGESLQPSGAHILVEVSVMEVRCVLVIP